MKRARLGALLALCSCMVACMVALSISDVATASVSSPVTFDYNGKSVRVKVYSRDVGEAKDHPVFKYGDLINRAIAYKTSHPATDVQIRFAMYKIGLDSYVGFDPNDPSYGYVKGYDHGAAHSEKLAYSIVKAAAHQVHVDFVYQKDADPAQSVYDYIDGFMDDPTAGDPNEQVGDYLNIRKVVWGSAAFQQMHSKFMTVSHYADDSGQLVADTVYTTTGNVDDHDSSGIPTGKDWVQSGMLINGHPELMESFDHYFSLIFAHADDQSDFQSAVRAAHAAGTLNYDDAHFSSYFFPIPVVPEGNYTYVPETGDGDPSNGNAWDPSFNPVAKYVDKMASAPGDRYFKANVYHLKTDNFGHKLYDELAGIYSSPSPGLKHFRLVVKTNSYDDVFATSNFNNIGIVKFPRLTHAKDYLFALSGLSEYYTVTGSTNLKLDEFASKANASVVVKEFTTDHPVYNAYKAVYEYQYED